MDTPILSLSSLSKSFGGTPVLRGVSLDVHKGEFITILGPSGCGKTTTLRIIAGLERPDSGRVMLSGVDVTDFEPNRRSVNTVFQNYALFPHMNVAQNIGYGLRVRRTPRDEIRRRVKEMLELVKLPGYEKRAPSQLSGGQRQRVAIARAVVLRPDILLLDEPLGALDLKLRQQMQTELKLLQQQLGITFIYITHDQEEALNMSDRIAVMNEGVLEQLGTPEMIYEHPKTPFVAQFIGQGSLFPGIVTDNCAAGRLADIGLVYGRAQAMCLSPRRAGESVTLSVHMERICYTLEDTPGFSLPATVASRRYAGSTLRTQLIFDDGQELLVSEEFSLAQLPPPGVRVNVYWDPSHAAIVGEEAV